MSIHELLANKEARHNTTLIFKGETGESLLIYKGESVTERELEERFPVGGKIGDAAYSDENPDKTHVN